MDYKEQGSHARGLYPAQDTSRTGIARMKQEEADITIILIEWYEIWKKGA